MSTLPPPVAPAEPIAEEDDRPEPQNPTVDIADEVLEAIRREARGDRVLALFTVSLAVLALVVVIWTGQRRTGRVEQRLTHAIERLTQRQVELAQLQQELAGTHAELALTRRWLEAAQVSIDELELAGRATTVAAAPPRARR